MFRTASPVSADAPLGLLDRLAIGYLLLPLVIFLAGWLRWWAAVPLMGCIVWSVRGLASPMDFAASARRSTGLQIAVAIGVGCLWTLYGGTDHIVYANADWHIRDAVLHDLVSSPWPVGYGPIDGRETILRAPLAFYLPAALIGKLLGLAAAHVAMLIWTACGVSIFLLQVLSLTVSRPWVATAAACIVVSFSGLDIIGNLTNDGPQFRVDWRITDHLEWWAGSYQYSSMTTQLFWVPNHALGAWLIVGLLYRCRAMAAFMELLPMLVVGVALWSPFSAIGIAPFAAAAVVAEISSRRSWIALQPQALLPALAVAGVLAAYLAMGAGTIPHGMPASHDPDLVMSFLCNLQFFLLEAGILGAVLLLLRASAELWLALSILFVLPWFSFGPSNDFVMRASIPSLAVMVICTVMALTTPSRARGARGLKRAASLLLLVGAVTPFEEMARAVLFPRWPINLSASLVGADCGRRAPHYVATLTGGPAAWLLRPASDIGPGPQGPASCANPALDTTLRTSR